MELEQGQMLLQPGWREPGCFPIDFYSLKEGGNTTSYKAGKVKGRELKGALNTLFIHGTLRNIPYVCNRVFIFFFY